MRIIYTMLKLHTLFLQIGSIIIQFIIYIGTFYNVIIIILFYDILKFAMAVFLYK